MTVCGIPQVRYIPASVPPHRAQPGASAIQRLEMARLAIQDQPGLIVDDQEVGRSGRSFTVDTLESLQRDWPQTDFSLIIGLDALLGFDNWHRRQRILEIVDIIAMIRPGWKQPEPLPDWWQPVAGENDGRGSAETTVFSAGDIRLLQIEPSPISATLIRQSIRAKSDPVDWLNPEVWEYIKTHKLYE